MSVTGFIKSVLKARMESAFAIAALLALFTAMMSPYVSIAIAVTLLVATGTCESAESQKQDRGYPNG